MYLVTTNRMENVGTQSKFTMKQREEMFINPHQNPLWEQYLLSYFIVNKNITLQIQIIVNCKQFY